MKKTIKIVMTLLLAVMLVGCRSKVPNAKRGTDYKYDFIDFINIKEYGEDGAGYIEITPREISLKDFSEESDYINVQMDLEALHPIYRQGRSDKTTLKVSKTEGLKNGDVINLKIDYRKEDLHSDMNIETYQYTMSNLGAVEEIDLFSPSLVKFFVTDTNDVMYYVKDNKALPADLVKNIRYDIRYQGNPEIDKTVLSIKADLDEAFLEENENYNSITMYLSKNNMKAKLEAEKVLTDVIHPIEFSGAATSTIESLLYQRIQQEEPDLAKVCNIQQLNRQKLSEPYNYYVVYFNSINGEREYFRKQFSMVYVEDTYYIYSMSSRENTLAEYAKEPFDEGEILMNFLLGDEDRDPNEVIEEEPVEEEVVVEEPQGPQIDEDGYYITDEYYTLHNPAYLIDSPSPQGLALYHYNAGDTVHVVALHDDMQYWKAEFNGTYGYVNKKYMDLSGRQ